MGGACSTYGGEVGCIQGFGGENVRDRDHLEGPGVGWRIILKGSSGSGMGGMDWVELAQERDRWLAFVNAVINLWVP